MTYFDLWPETRSYHPDSPISAIRGTVLSFAKDFSKDLWASRSPSRLKSQARSSTSDSGSTRARCADFLSTKTTSRALIESIVERLFNVGLRLASTAEFRFILCKLVHLVLTLCCSVFATPRTKGWVWRVGLEIGDLDSAIDKVDW